MLCGEGGRVQQQILTILGESWMKWRDHYGFHARPVKIARAPLRSTLVLGGQLERRGGQELRFARQWMQGAAQVLLLLGLQVMV